MRKIKKEDRIKIDRFLEHRRTDKFSRAELDQVEAQLFGKTKPQTGGAWTILAAAAAVLIVVAVGSLYYHNKVEPETVAIAMRGADSERLEIFAARQRLDETFDPIRRIREVEILSPYDYVQFRFGRADDNERYAALFSIDERLQFIPLYPEPGANELLALSPATQTITPHSIGLGALNVTGYLRIFLVTSENRFDLADIRRTTERYLARDGHDFWALGEFTIEPYSLTSRLIHIKEVNQ